MCGIAGIVALRGAKFDSEFLTTACGEMTDKLRHRGPDHGQIWLDDAGRVALGHRRLSIIDLSALGNQPMSSVTGRFTVTYNGEIYNYVELGNLLAAKGHAFRGSSDTEVLLACFEQWGVAPTLARLNGMFAFGVWDSRESVLHLARDRMGEKPLYFYRSAEFIAFSSELSAFDVRPLPRPTLDPSAVGQIIVQDFVESPRTIFADVEKLPPASHVTVRVDRPPVRDDYWCLEGPREPDWSPGEEEDVLASLIQDSVRMRLRADVELGVFLSAGIDSTLIASVAAGLVPKLHTFTASFDSAGLDEAPRAKDIASFLGTTHTTLPIDNREIQEIVPDLPAICDEPLADPSLIPTFAISRAARRHVTVALSGDGGDELFGGYSRYVWLPRIAATIRWMPRVLVRNLGRGSSALGASDWASSVSASRLAGNLGVSMPTTKLEKLGRILSHPAGLADLRISDAEDAHGLLRPVALGPARALRASPSHWPDVAQLMKRDAKTYLPDDVLTKVDRASMAVSLESRAPLLDHRIAEFASALPISAKINGRQGKVILRQVLARRVPPALWDQPKMGFSVPMAEWLRGPLREWASDLLASSQLRREELWEPAGIHAAWRAHQLGTADNSRMLWRILTVQSWLTHRRR